MRCWALLLGLLASGCGYTAEMPLAADGIRTVAVEVATNESLRQRLEIPLTREIYAALPIYAGLTPASHGSADAILHVAIEEVLGRSLVQGRQDPVREGALLFRVRAILRDRHTGAVLRDKVVADRAEFRSPIGETESSATDEAASDLARKIALALEADF